MRVNSRNKPWPWCVSRSEASIRGAVHYFSGVPRKYGRLARRLTKNGTCTECGKVAAMKHHSANQVVCNTRQLRRYHENREIRLVGMREWKAVNKDKIREINARRDPLDRRHRARMRRAKKKTAEGCYSRSDIKTLLSRQDGQCFYCARALGAIEEDHFIPLSKGGSNFIANIRLSCPTCNRKKKDAMPRDFFVRCMRELSRGDILLK